MCNRSPAKVLRSIKRIAKFIEKKHELLTVHILPQVNIYPILKPLEVSLPTHTSIPPKKKTLTKSTTVHVSVPPPEKLLSVAKVCFTDIHPDPLPCYYCMLVCERPNLPGIPNPLDPLCAVCQKPVDERFEPLECCNLTMHQHCCGGHRCEGWD